MKWKLKAAAVLIAYISGYAPLALATSPHAPVDVRALSGNHLKKTGSTTLELEFNAARSQQALEVMYAVDKGLALESSDKVRLMTQGNGRVKDTVRLRALRAGRLYLNVFMTMDHQGRVVSIPVQIGPEQRGVYPLAVGVKRGADAKGQALEVLPAQETSR